MVAYDAVVVGAGILGLSTAYHIKRADPSLKVLVVDKNVAAGLGSTAKSAAAFRCFFSSQVNFDLADTSVEFYQHVQEQLGVDLQMRFCGYLWAFTKDAYQQVLLVLKELSGKGLAYKEYAPDELTRILGMRVDFAGDAEAKRLGIGDVCRAVFVPKAGLIGVMSLVRFYTSEFLKIGGEIRYRTEVTKLLVEPHTPLGLSGEPYFWQDAFVVGVETTDGTIRAKRTVVATGPWLSQLLDLVGVECFVKARKRQVFSVNAGTDALKKLLYIKEFSGTVCLPFMVLAKPAIYFRPNLAGEGFGVGYADEFPRAFRLEEYPKPEADFFRYGLQPVLAKYFPQFTGARSSGGYAGLYEINTLDEHPVVFVEHGLVVVGGGSGSGIMKADAIGRIAAAAYADQEYASLYGEKPFRVSDLGLKNRRVEREKLVL